MTETKDIRARILLVNGEEEIKKFKPVNKLPTVGSKIVGTRYFYGKPRQVELAKNQRTRDDEVQGKYDFYIVNAVDGDNNPVGELCFCTPHRKSNKPTREMFSIFYNEARRYSDASKYVNAMMDSPIWDEHDIDNDGREGWLENIYKYSNMKFEDFLKDVGITQAQFKRDFHIPKRNVENWIYVRQPLPYVMMLIEENFGVISCE